MYKGRIPKLLLAIIIFYTILFSCKQPRRQVKEDSQREGVRAPEKVELYCWCFTNAEIDYSKKNPVTMPVHLCETLVRVFPSALVKPEYLLDSIIEAGKVKAFRSILLGKKEEAGNTNCEPDSRFVGLIYNSNTTTDTVVYINDSTFCVNRRTYIYPFNAMDSVRKLLNRRIIQCPSGL